MCANKPYIDSGNCELNYHHKAIFVAMDMDIDNVMLVPNHVSISEVLADVGQRMPFSITGYLIPAFEWNF